MTITARYPGKCNKCGGSIRVGEQIEWEKGVGAKHIKCPETNQAQARGIGQGFGPREDGDV
jgi:hypothetical protein